MSAPTNQNIWHKNSSDKWILPTNDITISLFKENLNDTPAITKTTNGNTVVYIPVHNIHDCYEWFRKFKDSYKLTDNFDTNGFGIHGYFNADRAQSISGWFKNLIEVKAASENGFVYEYDSFVYYRRQTGYIDIMSTYTNLVVDGVSVYDEEKILLKNQYWEIISAFIIATVFSTPTDIYIEIVAETVSYFKVGSTIILYAGANTYVERIINFMTIETIDSTDYLRINYVDIITEFADITLCADKFNGYYTIEDRRTENGVYQYDAIDGTLNRISEMADKYKTDGQIVYCYQGLTNENKEFYLNRIEDSTSVEYTKFPYDSIFINFIYSEGDAYLIKCELKYDLDTTTPLHPAVYDINNVDCYRLLFLDYDIADKVLSTNIDGIGDYKTTVTNTSFIDTNVELGLNIWSTDGVNQFSNILFDRIDYNEYYNVINAYLNYYYTNCPSYPQLIFRYIQLIVGEYLSIDFNNGNDCFITQNTNTSTIECVYPFSTTFPTNSIVNGDLINLKFQFTNFNTGLTHTALDFNFVVCGFTEPTGSIQLELYPKFDDNFINEFLTYSEAYINSPIDTIPNPNTYNININTINSYGVKTDDIISNTTEMELLEAAINKTELKNIYEITYDVNSHGYGFLNIVKPKQHHPWKWENHGVLINTLTVDESSVSTYYYYLHKLYGITQQYFKDYYNIYNFIQNYSNTLNTQYQPNIYQIAQLTNFNITYNNTIGALDRFSIYETATNTTGDIFLQKTNVIILGLIYKETALDNIKKHTVIHLYDDTSTLIADSLFINNIQWIENLREIHIEFTYLFYNSSSPLNTTIIDSISSSSYITFNIINDISIISTLLTNTKLNAGIRPYINYYNTRQDSASYAFGLMNYLINNKEILNIDNPTFDNILNGWGFDIEWTAELPGIRCTLMGGIPATSTLYQSNVFEYYNNEKTYEVIISCNTLVNGYADTRNTLSVYFGDNLISTKYFNSGDTFSFIGIASNNSKLTIIANTISGDFEITLSLITCTEIDKLLLPNITGVIYKENNEPRITLLKRDKKYKFSEDNILLVVASSVTNIDINAAPITLDDYLLVFNDVILLKNQLDTTENGIWIFQGSPNPLVRDTNYMNFNTVFYTTYGTVNINKSYKVKFDVTGVIGYGTTKITFVKNQIYLKKDNRLTFKPIAIAKLGVDNKIQPWQNINMKYDSLELEENNLNIEIGINKIHKIRFIDGLTEYKIINNIDGQGQYNWILDEDVIVDNAVVGCTKDNGPGTGTLIWYTGIWENGTWVDGIWIQGKWLDGVWLNGTMYAYDINDYYYYVTYHTPITANIQTIWTNGKWYNGTFNNGIINYIIWYDGTFNNGIINNGEWFDGTFNNGLIKFINWNNGTFNGGDFETGNWYDGTFQQGDPLIEARFGTKSTSIAKTIWYRGTFNSGEFWSGLNIVDGIKTPSVLHNNTVWFAGEFKNGDWYGGSFVVGSFKGGTWHGGVWFGGYYASSVTNYITTYKTFVIDPTQYDVYLGTTNNSHRMEQYNETTFYINADTFGGSGITAYSAVAYYNDWEGSGNPVVYSPKTLYGYNATQLILDVTAITTVGTTYTTLNASTHTLDGRPFINAVWYDGLWKGGIWLNGVWKSGIWESGIWVNGIFLNGTFGNI